MKTKFFLTLLLFATIANSKVLDIEIKSNLAYASSQTDVEKKLLVALAKTETSFNKYSIGIVANNPEMLRDFFKLNNVSFSQGKGERKKYFSLSINDKEKAEEYFYKFKYFVKKYPSAVKTYDLGLMQINISNIKGGEETEKMYLFNTKINSLYGAAILQQCFGKFKNVKYAIECYNKGTDKNKFGKFEYFNRVVTNYLSLNNYN